MSRCPNCSFELVLRKNSRKYKCAKCGRLYPQSKIDLAEFINWNKKKREEDKKSLNEEKRKQVKLTDFEKKERAKNYQAKYREKNREEYNRHGREYWAKNKIHLSDKRKENYNKRKDEIHSQQRLYRENNKIIRSINNLRTRQRELALKYLENSEIKPYVCNFNEILPTY